MWNYKRSRIAFYKIKQKQDLENENFITDPLNCWREAGVSDLPSDDLLLVTEPATVSLARVPAVLP